MNNDPMFKPSPGKPITILYMISSTDVGGAERMLERTIRGLNRTRFAPVVVSLTPVGEVGRRILDLGVPVHSLGLRPGSGGPLAMAGAVARAWRFIRQIRPAVLHGFMFHADMLGRLAGRLAGVPVVIGSLRSMHIGGPRRERLMGWLDPLVDRVTAVGRVAGKHQIARGSMKAGKLVVIHNGIELDRFCEPAPEAMEALRVRHGLPAGQRVLLHVGRLEPVKQQAMLIRAFAAATKSDRDWSLLIAGDGPLEGDLRAAARDAGIETRILLPGRIDDIVPLYYMAEAFVLSSAWEGMPNVVLEAMAAGRPVISTAVGSVPEMIEDGKSGWLCAPEEEAGLAGRIEQMIAAGPERRAAMGAEARRRVEAEFTMQRNLEKTEALYLELLKAKGIAGS